MNDKLKRRLIGAAVIVFVALALAALLPEPRLQRVADDDMRVVTIPLQDDAVATTAAPATDESIVAAAVGEGGPPEIESGDAPASTPSPSAALKLSPTLRPTPSAPPPAAPAPTARPTLAATPKPSATPTAKPTATATPRPTPPPTVAPTPQPTPAAIAADREIWWVQVGSYADIGNAREVESRLAALGQTVVVAPIEAAAGTLYRVRAGPYDSAARAESAHAQITRAGMTEARVIKP